MFRLLLGRSAAFDMAFMASMITRKAKCKFKHVKKYQKYDKLSKNIIFEEILLILIKNYNFYICNPKIGQILML